MRLTAEERRIIRELARRCFGEHSEVRVFGSRADDRARGGDLDLYVETELAGARVLDAELAFRRQLQEHLGEQRIDVVVHPLSEPASAIDAYAREEGVRL